MFLPILCVIWTEQRGSEGVTPTACHVGIGLKDGFLHHWLAVCCVFAFTLQKQTRPPTHSMADGSADASSRRSRTMSWNLLAETCRHSNAWPWITWPRVLVFRRRTWICVTWKTKKQKTDKTHPWVVKRVATSKQCYSCVYPMLSLYMS